MKNFVYLFLFVFIAAGCKSNEEQVELSPEQINAYMTGKSDKHNSRNSLDWEGTYSGVLPCGACVGIETIINIRQDHTYLLEQRMIDSPLEDENVITTGEFSWDETGNFITLHGEEEEMRLRVGELFLRPLNEKGFELTPVKGNNFKLLKQ